MALVATACTSSPDATDTSDTTAAPVSTTIAPTTTDAPAATDAPTGQPAADQLAWLVSVINGDSDLTVDEVEKRFAPAFLAQVPAAVFIQSTPQIFPPASRPYVLSEFDGADPTGLSGSAVLTGADGVKLNLQIQVESAAPNLIIGLLATPGEGGGLDLEAETLAEIDVALGEAAASSALGVYEVTDGDCVAVAELRAENPIPLGSVFKLWILAELGQQVADGTASWDELLAVQGNFRSSPDGQIFMLEDGDELTLQEYAEAMISISDNTATDHLLARVGRENVEAALVRIGVSEAEMNLPMLSTGNLFQLKFAASEPNAADYRALDTDGRRALLEEMDAFGLPWSTPSEVDTVNADGLSFNQPRDLDIEWFATVEDLCRTHVHLAELAKTPGLEPIAEILEINPGSGLGFERDRFPTIRFKGGSEPGVLAGAWWFERNDGRQFVVAGGASNPDAALSETEAIGAIASAVNLVS